MSVPNPNAMIQEEFIGFVEARQAVGGGVVGVQFRYTITWPSA
jgi:hypothetical protein